jgi:carbonic anhydrase
MRTLKHLFDKNRDWAERITRQEPAFFASLAAQQAPQYLWIGCADSRVPANEIVDLQPGELFVHRNVGNVVVHTDLNCLSVLQYAVDVLKVRYVIVCGHYGCGGVRAAYARSSLGLIDNWLRHIQDVRERHESRLDPCDSEETAVDRLCELNVLDQARNACQTSIVLDAWRRGQPLEIHSWIYSVRDGLLRDLRYTVTSEAEVAPAYATALDGLEAGAATR